MPKKNKAKKIARSSKTRYTSFNLQITADSPLLIGAGPPVGNVIESLDFIPGSAVRGMLIWRYLNTAKQNEDAQDARDFMFKQLFFDSNVKFGRGMPAGSRSIPLSARTCKYFPGFTDGHGVFDILARHVKSQENSSEFRSEWNACPVCAKPFDYCTGYIKEWPKAEMVPVDMRLQMHTAVDSLRRSAAVNQLFGEKLIDSGNHFISTIRVPEKLVKRMKETLNDGKPFSATVGKGSSRGVGWVSCQLVSLKSHASTTVQRVKRYSALFSKPVLVVTMRSDVLLQDNFLRDRTNLRISDLCALGIEPSDWIDSPMSIANTRSLFGFDGVPIELPRQMRTAIVAGSTYVFKSTRERWADVSVPDNSGVGYVGQNQIEGFGEVVLWDNFHARYAVEAKDT